MFAISFSELKNRATVWGAGRLFTALFPVLYTICYVTTVSVYSLSLNDLFMWQTWKTHAGIVLDKYKLATWWYNKGNWEWLNWCFCCCFLCLFSCLELYFSRVIWILECNTKAENFKATKKMIWIKELTLKGKEKELNVFILAERQWRRDISL